MPAQRAVMERCSHLRGRAAALGITVVGLLAGCGAVNGTSDSSTIPAPPVDLPTGGVDRSVGDVVLDDVYLQGSQGLAFGSTATLRLAVDNEAGIPDALIGVSSPVSTKARMAEGGRPVSSLALPAQSLTDLELQPAVQLTGLRQVLHPGEWLPVTLRFARAGPITMMVTVAPLGAAQPGVLP
jgi:hypothetical protein